MAIELNSDAFRYVHEQTLELCLLAVRKWQKQLIYLNLYRYI